MMSTGFQVFVVLLAFTVFSTKAVQDKMKQAVTLFAPIDLSPVPPDAPLKKQTMGGGGGGGDRSLLPASKGRLPKASLKQFTPPMAVVNNPNPKLTMDPSIIAPPDVNLPQVNMSQYGDPLAKIGPPSNGPGSGGGIGSGSGGGVGSGKGGGFGPGEGGGVGGGVYRVGGGVTAPALLYKVEPEYSEEARKAKYQGTVLLYIEVDPSGKAMNIRVARSLGLGLDEKAIEAVKRWKFKPGYKDGRPVTVAATIEVNFRLL
jgi:TonB family protein